MQYLPLNTNSACYLSLEETATRYAIDMGAWRRLREIIPSGWLEVRYESLVANLAVEAERALNFLGLPWTSDVLNYRQRLQSKPVSSPTYEAVSKPIYTSAIGRWKHYERHFGPALDRLQPLVAAFGYT